jgi:hypothetical protein
VPSAELIRPRAEVALTDGGEWRLHHAHAPVSVEQELFRAVRVSEAVDAAFKLLALLSTDTAFAWQERGKRRRQDARARQHSR